jgi:RHS repeat-associated protein
VLTREQDREGNSIDYNYVGRDLRFASGPPRASEYYLRSIVYGGKAGTAYPYGARIVAFDYEERPDWLTRKVVNGAAFKFSSITFTRALRLKTITVQAPLPTGSGTAMALGTVDTYTLGYFNANLGTGRSLLMGVSRTGSAGGTTWGKSFQYGSESLLPSHYHDTNISRAISPMSVFSGGFDNSVVGDFDFDGQDEVLQALPNSVGPGAQVYNPRTGALTTVASMANTVNVGFHPKVAADGFGPPTIVATDNVHWTQYKFTSSPWVFSPVNTFPNVATTPPVTPSYCCNYSICFDPSPNAAFLADLDGDGRLDLLVARDAQSCSNPNGLNSIGQPSTIIYDWFAYQGGTGASLALGNGPVNSFGKYQTMDADGQALDQWGNPYPYPSYASGYIAPIGDGSPQYPYAGFIESDAAGRAVARVGNLWGFSVSPGGNSAAWHVQQASAALAADLSAVPQTEWLSAQTLATVVNPSHCVKGNFDGASNFEGYCLDGSEGVDPLARLTVRDLDGDGRQEILAITPFFQPIPTVVISFDEMRNRRITTIPDAIDLLGDFNGDGLTDYIGGPNHTVHLAEQGLGDWLTEVWDEGTLQPAEQILYARDWTPTESTTPCAYPVACNRTGRHVVTEHDVYRGSQLPNTGISMQAYWRSLFSYDDARVDARGRGFLGYSRVRVWEPEAARETETIYDNVSTTGNGAYYAFMPQMITTRQPASTWSPTRAASQSVVMQQMVATFHYETLQPTPASYFIYPSEWKSTEGEADVTLNWNTTPWNHFGTNPVITTAQRLRSGFSDRDEWGNEWFSGGETSGGESSYRLLGFYKPDTDNWITGNVAEAMVSVTGPGETPTPRHVSYAYDDKYHPLRPTSITLEPDSTDPEIWSQTVISYSAAGLPTSFTENAKDPNNGGAALTSSTTIVYDPDEEIFPRRAYDALGHTTQLLYHPAYGQLVDAIDPNGFEVQRKLDDFGRTTTEWSSGSSVRSVSYGVWLDSSSSVAGTTVTTTSAAEPTRTVYLSRTGAPVRTSHVGFDGSLITVDRSYDVAGHLISETRPNSTLATTFGYDGLGRQVRKQLPDGTTEVTAHTFLRSDTYSPCAPSSTKDVCTPVALPSGAFPVSQKFVVRNPDDRTVQSGEVNKGTSITTNYQYGNFGQLIYAYDPLNNLTSISYDLRGRRTLIVDPDRGKQYTHYNGYGDVTSESDSGHDRYYYYDELGRNTLRWDDDGWTQFGYDTQPYGIGKRAFTQSPSGVTETFFYEAAAGRPWLTLTDVDGEPFWVGYGYDQSGRLSDVQYPTAAGRASTFTIQNQYNAYGYLSSITETDAAGAGRTFFAVTARNADDALTGMTFWRPSGWPIQESRGYDPVTGRAKTETAAVLTYPNVFDVTYEYNPDGSVASRTDLGNGRNRKETYDYDQLHRLTGWHLSQPVTGMTRDTSYHYGVIGNLEEVTSSYQPSASSLATVVHETSGYGCNGTCASFGPHQLWSRTVAGVQGSYTYDDRGRQVSAPTRSDVTYTTFDLPRTITAGGQTTKFDYDADHDRIKKTSSAGSTVEIAGIYELRRSTVGSITTTRHVHKVFGPDGDVAQVTYDPGANADTVEYALSDHLGTSSVVVTPGGAVTSTPDHAPFGARVDGVGEEIQANPSDVRVGFAGHLQDDELGLIHMRGRTYDPTIRRFLSADPLVSNPGSPQSFNRYSYVHNDPINKVDPTGFTDDSGGGGSDGGGGGDSGGGGSGGSTGSSGSGGSTGWSGPAKGYSGGPALPQPVQGPTATTAANTPTPSSARMNPSWWPSTWPQQVYPDVTYGSGTCPGMGYYCTGPTALPFYLVLSHPGLWSPQVNRSAATALGDALDKATKPLALVMAVGGIQLGALGGMIGVMEVGATMPVWLRAAGQWLGLGGSACAGTGSCDRVTREVSSTAQAVRSLVSFCFAAGTKVLLADGTTKPIEEIEPGDYVLTDDPSDSSGPRSHRVTALIPTETHRLFHVEVAGPGGGEILSTGSHPFWTDRGWVVAEELTNDDMLLDDTGRQVSIASLAIESRDAATYNLTVEGDHTFFVVAGHRSVLVHNVDPYDVWFTHDNVDPYFEHGDLAGRDVRAVGAEARKLQRMPAGLRLEAMRMANGIWASLNNRTLMVARLANLRDVTVHDVGDAGANKFDKNLREAGILGPVENAYIRCK